MPIKFDMVFGQQSLSTGWVETWYLNTTDLDDAVTKAQDIARARAAVLATGVVIRFIRVSQNIPPRTTPPNPRRQRLMLLRDMNLPGFFQGTSDFSDTSWQALKLRWESTVRGNFRMQELRGILDRSFIRNTVGDLRGIYQAALDTYKDALVRNAARIRHKVRGIPPTDEFQGIQNVIIEGVTRRATGRPLYLYRGRRPNRKVTPTP